MGANTTPFIRFKLFGVSTCFNRKVYIKYVLTTYYGAHSFSCSRVERFEVSPDLRPERRRRD